MLPASCPKLIRKSVPFGSLPGCASSLATNRGDIHKWLTTRRCNDEQAVQNVAGIKTSNSTKLTSATSAPKSAWEGLVNAPLNLQAGDRYPNTMTVPITAGRVPYSLHPQLVAEYTAAEESRDTKREKTAADMRQSRKQRGASGAKAGVDGYVVLMSKVPTAIHVFHAQCLCYWPYFAAGNTMLATELAATPFLWQGVCGLAAVALVHKLAQFAVACHTQGSRALAGAQCDQKYAENLEVQLSSVVKGDVHRLQPDSEEDPTPALQFFCSGAVSSAVALYITIKAAQFLNYYPGFGASSALLSLLAGCNAVGLVFTCILCYVMVLGTLS